LLKNRRGLVGKGALYKKPVCETPRRSSPGIKTWGVSRETNYGRDSEAFTNYKYSPEKEEKMASWC